LAVTLQLYEHLNRILMRLMTLHLFLKFLYVVATSRPSPLKLNRE